MNVSAFKTPERNYVAVIVNNGEAKEFTYVMPGYTTKVYVTDADRNLELTTDGWYVVSNVDVPATSIVTVVFEPLI